MPIVAKNSSEKVYLNINQINELERHSKHSDFHESLLAFYIKNGFLTEKQEKYINNCNYCNKGVTYNPRHSSRFYTYTDEGDGHWSNFGW